MKNKKDLLSNLIEYHRSHTANTEEQENAMSDAQLSDADQRPEKGGQEKVTCFSLTWEEFYMIYKGLQKLEMDMLDNVDTDAYENWWYRLTDLHALLMRVEKQLGDFSDPMIIR